MKKLLTLLLTLLMVFTLVGCDANKDSNTVQEPITQEEVVEPEIEEDDILGGYEEVEDGTLTDELKDIFDTALDGLLGAKYEPVELVATQVVAGINYKFLANGTKTTNPITEGKYYITVYKDLQGKVKLLDIETIEESSAAPKKEADESLNYWVVFYNPDGNELQRTAQKYGTTPKYEGEEPYYWDVDYWYRFICWTDKDGNEIKEFKPITGNTYIYAKYEIGGENKPVEKEVTPSGLTMVTVTFELPGADAGYVVTGGSPSEIYSVKVPINSTYSYDNNSFTINGIVYTFAAKGTLGVYEGTEILPSSAVSDGKIIANVTFTAHFGPP